MGCSNIIESELKKGDISKSLHRGSSNKDLITDLQRVLFELGFREKLKWNNYEADGEYGNATTAAILAFAKKNKYKSDGTSVSNTLTNLILQRHDFLPDMYILWSIYKSDLRTRKYLSKGTRMSVTAIQVFLNELGYGKELNFPKYGADGFYGSSTKKALIAFAHDNEITSNGDLLTRPLVNLLIKKINPFYGKNWSDLAKKYLPNNKSPLVLYDGSRFRGKPCRADVQFIPSLEKINTYAKQAKVHVFVTSSFRTSTNVRGAIVKPATRSNHMAGHGIDMNIIYGNDQFANSKVLNKYPSVAEPVRRFIKFILDDPSLRWGGEFRIKDVVHIDDGLNKNRNKWDERYQAIQQAVQLAG
ncbi:MAG: hypothetical protein COA50_11700 [Flavobacteriaceae bacterium]|nr:MAG: hypothetical protein COA50_11700 [Flavobacteriaceae bacterium]